MTSLLTDNPVAKFSTGFFMPLTAARFIKSNPSLLKFVLIPFQINLVVFSLAIYFGLTFFQNVVVHYIPQGDAWYWMMLTYFVWTVAVLATMVLVFFSFTVVGNLIASPFNDLLSQRTEELLTGQPDDEPFSFNIFWQDAIRTIFNESKKMLLFISGMIFLLFLNFIPVFGTVMYSFLSVVWTIFFLVIEYTGFVFSRKRATFKDHRQFISSYKSTMTGFGCGVLLSLAVPFLQFFCIPLAVIGATILCHQFDAVKSS